MAMRNPRTKFRKMWEHQWKTSISKGFSKAMSTCQRLVPNIFNFMRMSRSDTLIHPYPSSTLKSSLKQLGSPGSSGVPCAPEVVCPCSLPKWPCKMWTEEVQVPGPIWGLALLSSLSNSGQDVSCCFPPGDLKWQAVDAMCMRKTGAFHTAHLEYCRVCGLKAYRIHRPIGSNRGSQKWWSPNDATASLAPGPSRPNPQDATRGSHAVGWKCWGPDALIGSGFCLTNS